MTFTGVEMDFVPREAPRESAAEAAPYFIVSKTGHNQIRITDTEGTKQTKPHFKGGDYLKDGRAWEKNGGRFLPGFLGFVGKDGKEYQPSFRHPDAERILMDGINTLRGDDKVRSVMALPVCRQGEGDGLYMNIHLHQEPAEAWGYKQTHISTPGGLVNGHGGDPRAVLETLIRETHEETGFPELPWMKVNGLKFDPEKKRMYVAIETPLLPPLSAPPEISARFSPFMKSLKQGEEYVHAEVRAAHHQGMIVAAARQDGVYDTAMTRNARLHLEEEGPFVRPESPSCQGMVEQLKQHMDPTDNLSEIIRGRAEMFHNEDLKDFLRAVHAPQSSPTGENS